MAPKGVDVGGFAQWGHVFQQVVDTPEITTGIRLAVAGVFLLAGLHKVRRPRDTAVSIANFRLGALATVPAAVLLGVVEIVLAVALAVPATARAAGFGCAALSSVFVFLTARAYRSGERFACNCLSSSAGPIDAWTVARSVAVLVGGIASAVLPTVAFAAWQLPLAVAVACALAGLPVAVATLAHSISVRHRYMARIEWDFVVERWSGG